MISFEKLNVSHSTPARLEFLLFGWVCIWSVSNFSILSNFQLRAELRQFWQANKMFQAANRQPRQVERKAIVECLRPGQCQMMAGDGLVFGSWKVNMRLIRVRVNCPSCCCFLCKWNFFEILYFDFVGPFSGNFESFGIKWI